MQNILCSFLFWVQDACTVGQCFQLGSGLQLMQKGTDEKAEDLMLNVHKWACLIQILPSYTLNRGCKTQEQNRDCKTQVPLTLKKVQAEFHPPANYMW